jgi:hypothetical protein
VKTRTFYTTERSPVAGNEWKRMDTCYVRGVDIASEFDADGLEDLQWLVEIVNSETEWAEYRIVKITEQTKVVFIPQKTTQLKLSAV